MKKLIGICTVVLIVGVACSSVGAIEDINITPIQNMTCEELGEAIEYNHEMMLTSNSAEMKSYYAEATQVYQNELMITYLSCINDSTWWGIGGILKELQED